MSLLLLSYTCRYIHTCLPTSISHLPAWPPTDNGCATTPRVPTPTNRCDGLHAPSGFLCFGISSVSARKRSGWVVVVVIRVEAAAEVRTREKKSKVWEGIWTTGCKAILVSATHQVRLGCLGWLAQRDNRQPDSHRRRQAPSPRAWLRLWSLDLFPWLAATLGRGHPWTKNRNSHMRWFTSLPRQFFTRERRPVLGLVRSLRSLSP